MKDQVHLNKAHLGGIPVGQLQRDGFVEQGGLPGIAGSIIAPFFLMALRSRSMVAGADGLKLHGRAPRDPKVTSPYQGIDLGPKQGRQSLATGVIKELPQPQQDAMDLCSITTRPLFRRWPGFKQQALIFRMAYFRFCPVFLQYSSRICPFASREALGRTLTAPSNTECGSSCPSFPCNPPDLKFLGYIFHDLTSSLTVTFYMIQCV